MPLIMVVSAFAALISSGGAPRASIFMGQGDYESAEQTMGSCFSLQVIVSLLLTVILLAGNRTFLLAFGASENTIAYAVDYMQIYTLGTIFVQLTLLMEDKTMAVYMAEPVADVLAVTFTALLFRVQFKKALKQIS